MSRLWGGPLQRGGTYDYEELIHRDKISLTILGLRKEDLEAALEQFREIAADLRAKDTEP
jgi:hypothetical protein